jgi:hypothetical protein
MEGTGTPEDGEQESEDEFEHNSHSSAWSRKSLDISADE